MNDLIKYTDNSEKMIKWLAQNHGLLNMAGADTLTAAAKVQNWDYLRRLERDFTIRNHYTLKSTKVFPAHAKKKDGTIRPLPKIDAKVVVRKQRGGKDHYLGIQEDGGIKHGNPMTLGNVPVPLNAARPGASNARPISPRFRLDKGTQSLLLGGTRFGYNDKFNARGQKWAIMNKYKKAEKWDLTKPFIFDPLSNGKGIYAQKGNKTTMIRTLGKSAIHVKGQHNFEKSLDALIESFMEYQFLKAARKYIR